MAMGGGEVLCAKLMTHIVNLLLSISQWFSPGDGLAFPVAAGNVWINSG